MKIWRASGEIYRGIPKERLWENHREISEDVLSGIPGGVLKPVCKMFTVIDCNLTVNLNIFAWTFKNKMTTLPLHTVSHSVFIDFFLFLGKISKEQKRVYILKWIRLNGRKKNVQMSESIVFLLAHIDKCLLNLNHHGFTTWSGRPG